MTKKDFQLIAAVLASTPLRYDNPEHARYRLAEEFARVLSEGNPRFKRDLFIQAATGVVAVTARKAKREPSTPDELMASASDVPGYNSPSARLLRGITEKSARRTGAPAIVGRTLASDLAEDR